MQLRPSFSDTVTPMKYLPYNFIMLGYNGVRFNLDNADQKFKNIYLAGISHEQPTSL